LLYEGQVVPLSAKLFDILLLLVRNSGILVTKGTLMKIIWSKTAVEENNLTVSISQIRKVLDKNRKGHSYIQTVSGHGYRLAANVKTLDSYKIKQSARNKTPNSKFNNRRILIKSWQFCKCPSAHARPELVARSDDEAFSRFYFS
jgi:DNA-binding winged helix-turn-helix (wHTH) protein